LIGTIVLAAVGVPIMTYAITEEPTYMGICDILFAASPPLEVGEVGAYVNSIGYLGLAAHNILTLSDDDHVTKEKRLRDNIGGMVLIGLTAYAADKLFESEQSDLSDVNVTLLDDGVALTRNWTF